MNEQLMNITEVINEFTDWIEFNWAPENMSPSQYRQALMELDELIMMSFDEILESYDTLYLDIEEFDFDIHDEEFETKYTNIIKDHIDYIESTAENEDSYGEEDW